jgi:L-lactate utilization protein LutC
MKRTFLVIFGIVAVTTGIWAQDRGTPPPAPSLEPGASQADVDRAVLAAPANLRAQATVIKWKADGSYDTLRKGTNRLVCYDVSGFPLHAAFEVVCTMNANLPRVVQNLKAEALGDRAKSEAMLNEQEKNGTRVKPEFGSVWYHVEGPNQATAHPHMTIAVPGATQATLGLAENGRGGGVWIMNAGTSTAHLMTPGE